MDQQDQRDDDGDDHAPGGHLKLPRRAVAGSSSGAGLTHQAGGRENVDQLELRFRGEGVHGRPLCRSVRADCAEAPCRGGRCRSRPAAGACVARSGGAGGGPCAGTSSASGLSPQPIHVGCGEERGDERAGHGRSAGPISSAPTRMRRIELRRRRRRVQGRGDLADDLDADEARSTKMVRSVPWSTLGVSLGSWRGPRAPGSARVSRSARCSRSTAACAAQRRRRGSPLRDDHLATVGDDDPRLNVIGGVDLQLTLVHQVQQQRADVAGVGVGGGRGQFGRRPGSPPRGIVTPFGVTSRDRARDVPRRAGSVPCRR